MKQLLTTIEFCRRLDAALAQKPQVHDERRNIACEVCGDNIGWYIGPVPGVICSNCLQLSGEGLCTRVLPLAITRGTLNESGE